MNILYKLTTILFILFTSCSIKQEDTLLKGELLYEDKADQRYYDLELTESYLILLAQNSDSIIQVFKKEKPDKLYAFAPKGYGDTYFSKPEFMKSNSKDPAEKDEVWIVDNQLSFNKIRIKETLFFKREPLFYELYSSTYYNVTTQETYAVPFGKEKTLAPFYFANDEKGVYWVEYSKAETRYRNCHALAYL